MIGVLDSGVGGLGVLAEIRRAAPEADLLYVADHAGSPYGTKSLAAVRQRVGDIVTWLLASGCEVIVLACNTASAAALHWLRDRHPGVAFVGMEPALKPAAVTSRRGRVGVVATAATFQAELFSSVVDRFASTAEVTTAACPHWVELVEAGTISGPVADESVRTCLQPIIEAGADTLVLACTHYPALIEVISAVMGSDVEIIDPAPAVARQTARVATDRRVAIGSGSLDLRSTGDAQAVSSAARRLGLSPVATALPFPAWTPETSP